MKRIVLAVVISAFAAGSAMAASCESQAVSKDGKPLSGASRTSTIKACKEKACAGPFMDKNNKPMTGIVKEQAMKKCMDGA